MVGAGAAGSAAAWWLARRGRAVTLLEQFGPRHDRGSSHGRSRIFRLAYPDPDDVRRCVEAKRLWDELEDDCGETLRETPGALDHGDDAVVAAIAAALAEVGAPHTLMTAEEAGERYPFLRFDGDVLLHPDGGRTDAEATVAACVRRAGELGADVRYDTPVRALRMVGDGVEVDTDDGTIRAGLAVVAAGAWTAPLLGGLVDLPPLTVTQEQYVHVRPHEPVPAWPSTIHRAEPHLYNLLTPGEGIKIGIHTGGKVVDPDTRDGVADPGAVAQMVAHVADWIPGADASTAVAGTCLYTSTPSERFLIDRLGPLVVSSACSGTGFKFTPLIGRILADLVDDPDAAPSRFRITEHTHRV
ncbi:MAG: FAD-dependent oxidoreductase [Actinomycetota bacterium]|nr:FAD-dependent oxidoreductase [Actinomycetota bacterium]